VKEPTSTRDTRSTIEGGGPVSFVRRHEVLCFFVLAYVLAWGAVPWHSFFAPGALIAALVIVAISRGLEGLRELGTRLIRWRVGWIWYVVAIAVPLTVLLVTFAVNASLGGPAVTSQLFTPWYGIPLAIAVHVINPTNGAFSEEPSFRGFAQPTLQRTRSPLAATAIMAIAVTGWHLPLFLMPSFGLKPFEAVTTVAVTFWYAWLFNHAGGSSLITLLAHGTEGSVNVGAIAGDATRQAWIYLMLWSIVAVLLLVADRSFWTAEPAQMTSARRRRGERSWVFPRTSEPHQRSSPAA
jgi:uncharacterized protein